MISPNLQNRIDSLEDDCDLLAETIALETADGTIRNTTRRYAEAHIAEIRIQLDYVRLALEGNR